MVNRKCIVLGAGGHARVVIDALLASGTCEVAGIIDVNPHLKGTAILGVEVLGADDCLPHLLAAGIRVAVIGIGGVGDNRPREKAFLDAMAGGFQIAGVRHPSAVVSPFAAVDPTAQILAGSHVGPLAVIGPGVIVNTAAVVEHDCHIGRFAHIASAAVLGGNVTVGEFAHVGSGAAVKQELAIGSFAVIGSGAVVTRDVAGGMIVAGVPARLLSNRE